MLSLFTSHNNNSLLPILKKNIHGNYFFIALLINHFAAHSFHFYLSKKLFAYESKFFTIHLRNRNAVMGECTIHTGSHHHRSMAMSE